MTFALRNFYFYWGDRQQTKEKKLVNTYIASSSPTDAHMDPRSRVKRTEP